MELLHLFFLGTHQLEHYLEISAGNSAGNTVVIKPSERASCSTLELMKILEEADLPEGLINVVTGFGPTTGAPLIEHQDVRMISFTGGTKGGVQQV